MDAMMMSTNLIDLKGEKKLFRSLIESMVYMNSN